MTSKGFLYRSIAIFIVLVVSLFILPTARPAYAALPVCNLNDPNWLDVNISCLLQEFILGRQGGQNSGAYYNVALGKNMYSMADYISGVVSSNDPSFGQAYLQNSAIGKLGGTISMMYQNPPADFGLWVADTGASLGFMPKPVYAQGLGFSGLSLLLPIWKVFRNIAYFLMAIVMVAIGFLVMFRKKIDPKTVVTVQNALPRIIVTLILITFSYAIVGFLIDLMYLAIIVVIRLLASSIASTSPSIDTSRWITDFTSSSFGTVMKAMLGSFRAIDDIFFLLWPQAVIPSSPPPPSFWTVLLGTINVFTTIGGTALFALLIGFAVLFMVIRIFFMLLNSYIQIIISLITAPLHLLLDVFPGGTGFASWINNLISNLVVFPVTAFMLAIGYFLMRQPIGTVWTPPLLGTGGTGTLGIIGLGVLMVIPNVVKGIKESLKAKPIIGATPGAITSPLTETFQSATSAASLFYYGKMLWPGKKEK